MSEPVCESQAPAIASTLRTRKSPNRSPFKAEKRLENSPLAMLRVLF